MIDGRDFRFYTFGDNFQTLSSAGVKIVPKEGDGFMGQLSGAGNEIKLAFFSREAKFRVFCRRRWWMR